MLPTTAPAPAPDHAAQREAYVERILGAVAGAFDLFALYLGDRLGYYDALAQTDTLTPPELAERTDTFERYAREWLEQQAVTGVLTVENPEAPAAERRFGLPAGHAEALTDRESLNFVAPLGQLLAGAVAPLEQLVAAYRTGDGVPYAAYGRDLREGQGRMNRAMLLHQFGPEYLATLPDVHARLQRGARVADVGCGYGWAAIGMALSYPKVEVDGFDLDPPSVEAARRHAEQYGVAERVRFHVQNVADEALAGQYHLVTAVECVHDLGEPVAALQAMRRLCADDGTVLVVDERVREHFTVDGGPDSIDRMMYGWSMLHCLPVGIADCDGAHGACAATGTVMRPATLRGYADAAGFERVEVLPIENYFFRFYRLHP